MSFVFVIYYDKIGPLNIIGLPKELSYGSGLRNTDYGSGFLNTDYGSGLRNTDQEIFGYDWFKDGPRFTTFLRGQFFT